MRILALDTSGPVAAVAVAQEDAAGYRKLIGGFRLQSGFTHSQTLMPMLEEMKTLAGIDLATLDYIAVASGPGSFTGLRIGASAAKGLAFALEKPLVPVPTLDAMAYRLTGVNGLVCPMMDARRSQVYAGVYRFEREPEREKGFAFFHRMTCPVKPCAIAVRELTGVLNRLHTELFGDSSSAAVHLLGDGVPVSIDTLRKELNVPFRMVPFHLDRQSAEAVCALAFELVREGKAVDAGDFSPEYLRKSQAETAAEQNES